MVVIVLLIMLVRSIRNSNRSYQKNADLDKSKTTIDDDDQDDNDIRRWDGKTNDSQRHDR